MTDVRPARTGDHIAIAGVHTASWRFSYQGIFSDAFLQNIDSAKRERFWQGLIADMASDPLKTGIVVATQDSVIKGFVSVIPSRKDGATNKDGEIAAIYVDPDSQGNGYGHALMAAAFAWLKKNGFSHVFVHTLAASPYKRFYAKMGGVLQPGTFPRTFGDHTLECVEYQWVV